MENKKIHEDIQRYLQFKLGKEKYAIPLLSVKEVIPPPSTTPLPNSPSYYIGIMNLRGQIISILDLRKKLSIISKQDEAEQAVIIIEIEGVGIGVVVDSIHRVLNISEQSVSEVPEVSSQVNAKYIEGVYQGENDLTILLDLVSVLNINNIKKIQNKAA
ncbi:MAG: chemotaxis protein CheW [Bacteriovoracaceae bacterium]|jgi:purine-binding chemotaxis protein CheW|nr:chemotaxis protein CheW [Bacteriovoracaceae bacterium]